MTTMSDRGQVYLQTYLSPLAELLQRSDVTDVYINVPGEAWIETQGGDTEHHNVPALDTAVLTRLARQIAAHAHQGISREHPLLSATLPGGERVQIVMPPATRDSLAFAIRKHVTSNLSLADYGKAGAFEGMTRDTDRSMPAREAVKALFEAGPVPEALSAAVKARQNILIAGGTSTGKTTFLNALIGEIPSNERLIFIEDTPELRLQHNNAVGLLAPRSALGEASVSAEDLLNASLRMRPDRVILGELRGPEAFTFLRAVNTGHPGSMTTVHADSPDRAVEQIALLVLQGGTQLRREDILHYVRSTIDVFVQLARVDGRRRVTHVRLRPDL